MRDFDKVKEIFTKLTCGKCLNHFKPEGITLVKYEHGYFVIKVDCVECDNSLGLVILAVPEIYQAQMERERELEPFVNMPAITFDDVLEAHKFIESLEADWTKYLPQQSFS